MSKNDWNRFGNWFRWQKYNCGKAVEPVVEWRSVHTQSIEYESSTYKEKKLIMNIDKDAAKGSGNTFMEFNIGHVENLNPAATTVVNANGGIGIFEKYVATQIAASFKDGKESTVRPELGFRPSKEIQSAIDTLMNKLLSF